MFWFKWISIIAVYPLVYAFSRIFSFGSYVFPCLLASVGAFFFGILYFAETISRANDA